MVGKFMVVSELIKYVVKWFRLLLFSVIFGFFFKILFRLIFSLFSVLLVMLNKLKFCRLLESKCFIKNLVEK